MKDYNSYFTALVDLDSKQQELLSKSEKYRDYIDERVLWIRSTHPLAWGDVRKAAEAVGWIVKTKSLAGRVRTLPTKPRTNPLVVALAALLFASCLWIQRQLKRCWPVICLPRTSPKSTTMPSVQPGLADGPGRGDERRSPGRRFCGLQAGCACPRATGCRWLLHGAWHGAASDSAEVLLPLLLVLEHLPHRADWRNRSFRLAGRALVGPAPPTALADRYSACRWWRR